MSAYRKKKHLIGAITHSFAGLLTSFVLIGVGSLALLYIPSSDIVSLFIGIIGSVIASIIYSIADKYSKSCSSFIWILNQIEIILAYINEIICDNFSNKKQCKFELWRFYVELCEKSYELTYEEDFIKLSYALNNIIKIVNQEHFNNVLLKKAKKDLVSIRNELTE